MWVRDPKTKEKSVSLTLLMVSFLAIIVCSVAHVFGKLDSTGPLLELFYATAALYFGRRVNFKRGELDEAAKREGEGS